MKLKLTVFVVFLILGISSPAQERVCAYKTHMKEKLKDLEFRKEYEERQTIFRVEYERLLANPRARMQTIYIPVAVHYPEANESDRACLVNLAKDQIRILNEDFTATNADLSKWGAASSHYPGVNTGSIDIEFVLATKNHPTGVDEQMLEGEPAVTIGEPISDSDARFSGYQNFIVKPLSGTTLGYSPLGGKPSDGDSVVMRNTAFGSGSGCSGYSPGAPFNLGRTVTHELGHHYNLEHTFSGGCSSDDGVSDTPNLDDNSSGCPTDGSIQRCSNKILTQNYMDYTDDACMFMFTEGQAIRMLAYINTIKDDWKNNAIEIENGNETTPPIVPENEFNIYPNPVSENIHISFPIDKINSATYSLYDILGKVVLNETIGIDNEVNEIMIETSQFSNGIYILSFNSSVFSKTKKIIINH